MILGKSLAEIMLPYLFQFRPSLALNYPHYPLHLQDIQFFLPSLAYFSFYPLPSRAISKCNHVHTTLAYSIILVSLYSLNLISLLIFAMLQLFGICNANEVQLFFCRILFKYHSLVSLVSCLVHNILFTI